MRILLLAIGLSADAMAVSLTQGAVQKSFNLREALRIALVFGIFQAGMPLLGWLAIVEVEEYLAGVDHWIAFILLSIIGLKMILESHGDEEAKSTRGNLPFLLMLGVATSIDALIVGTTLGTISDTVISPVVMIGVVTFILSLVGVYVGCWTAGLTNLRVEILGGIVLILLGISILVEHLDLI